MKKTVLSFVIICLSVSCTHTLYNSSSWQSKPVAIDGKLNEWPDPLRFYDQATGINYSISNDHFNLYFCCSITNEFLQTKILRAGLDFTIDTLGKKSFGVGFKYPMANPSERNPVPENNPGSRPDANGETHGRSGGHSGFKLKLLAEAREMELIGFKSHIGKIISLSPPNNTGISAAIKFDERGIMNYEAVIPFSTFYKNVLTPADSNTIFNYQIKINADSKSNSGNNGISGSGGGGMHRGGMRGGGMGGGGMRGGGMRGGGMNDGRGNDYRRNANSSGLTKTTIKLKLAYK